MTIATRLALSSSAVIALVMSVVGALTVRQRETQGAEALVRETETLAQTLQIVANTTFRTGDMASLDRVLKRRVEREPNTILSVVVDSRRRLVAGGPAGRLACLDSVWPPGVTPAQELHVWARCGERIRFVVLPIRGTSDGLVVAQSTGPLDRALAVSRQRIVLTTLVLATLASLAILLVSRWTLSRPLEGIMAGVRSLGGPEPAGRIRPPRQQSELSDLVTAFNDMAERLEANRQSLLRQADERIALERRLQQSESFAALGRVSGGIAHELGSPLGVIAMRAEAIEANPSVPAEAKEQAARIVAEVDRIVALVQSLLQVARRHPIAGIRTDLNEVVGEVVRAVEGERSRHAVEIAVRPAPGAALVEGDPVLLRHALTNVVVNGIQSMKRSGGDRRLTIEVDPREERVGVVVQDSGPGIAPQDEAHVFEPFFTTKGVGEGMGLGLAISRGIVEDHGGELALEPSRNGGARFRVELPSLRGREPADG